MASSAKSQAIKDRATGKEYQISHDALGHTMLGRKRDKSIPGYRTMSGAQRYNHKLHRTFDNAKEDRHDPVLKSFHRHHRRHGR